jgi:hypothetical protein
MSFKTTLSSMNLARWIIVIGALGTLTLGVTGWMLHQKRVEYEAALEPGGEVERLAKSIQSQGKNCTQLQAAADRTSFKGQTDAVSYIRDLARNPAVLVGLVAINPLTAGTPAKGVTDNKYQIKPQEQTQTFGRDRIANFMWKLESDSGRLRVTNLRMMHDGNPKEWEIENDLWKYEIEVTSRQKDVAPAVAPKPKK